MEETSSNQPKSTIDQKEQKISGDQTNVAGNYYAAPAQPSQWPQYLFLLAVVLLLATITIVALLTDGRFAGNAEPTIPSPPTRQAEESVGDATNPTTHPTVTNESDAQIHCLQQYGSALRKENVIALEEGVRDTDIQLNQDEYLVVNLTESKKPIGLIHFLLFPDSKSFKVEKILNEQCVEEANNKSTTLDDWEALEFSLNVERYTIRLGYQGDHIRIIGLRHSQ